jgi:hypothetical protein
MVGTVILNDPTLQFVGTGSVGPIPVPILYTVVVVLVVWFMAGYTRFGLYTHSIGSNREATVGAASTPCDRISSSTRSAASAPCWMRSPPRFWVERASSGGAEVWRVRSQGLRAAVRRDRIRFGLHIYNSVQDVDDALAVLATSMARSSL